MRSTSVCVGGWAADCHMVLRADRLLLSRCESTDGLPSPSSPSSSPPSPPDASPAAASSRSPSGISQSSCEERRDEVWTALETAAAISASRSASSPPSIPARLTAIAAAVASIRSSGDPLAPTNPLRSSAATPPSSGLALPTRGRTPFCCWRSLAATCSTRPAASTPCARAGMMPLFCRFSLRSSRRSALFQWFLMALSVRPGSILAISAHRLPSCRCASSSTRSSSAVQWSFLMAGSSWLCQRSRHCLPVLPVRLAAMSDQHLVPCVSTSCRTVASSSSVHGRFRGSSFFSSFASAAAAASSAAASSASLVG
mmetsp:Transcript_15571/g.49461  ORF Transcript_15571/g.49461 Transcript_15571/m.49461 type:complete len:313 (+) Transcript_15571:205-1143(+)